jgi:hypothetical protein
MFLLGVDAQELADGWTELDVGVGWGICRDLWHA